QIAHEVLAHLEAVPFEEPDADEEGVGSRATREPGRLGIEKQQARSIVRGDVPSHEQSERHRLDLTRASQRMLAVAMLEMESASNDHHAPGVIFLDGAPQRVFDGRRAARGLAETALRLDPPDHSAKIGYG